MQQTVENKKATILVTGSSRGIGFEVCLNLAQQPGTKIIATARNIDSLRKLEQQVEKLNNQSVIFPLQLDMENYGFEKALIETLQINKLMPSTVIHNAGLLINKPFAEMTTEDFDRSFSVNTKAVFILSQTLLPFLQKPAHILTISSMGGYQGSAKFPGLSLYSASKAALAVLTECMAEEFKNEGIKANCLALGAVQTEMLAEAFPGYQAPLSANEMAGFIADFALNGHRFFNGKILPVSVSTP